MRTIREYISYFTKEWLKPSVLLLIIVLFAIYVSVWGLLILFFAYTIYRLYLGWDKIKMGATQIEYLLWGRPLEKEYWTKEAWANRPRFKLFPNWKFEWIPSNISMGIDLRYRYSLFMCIFGFAFFVLSFINRRADVTFFAYIFYTGALFSSVFLLLQVLAGAKIIYDRLKQRTKRNTR
jgi:hypothetical protein